MVDFKEVMSTLAPSGVFKVGGLICHHLASERRAAYERPACKDGTMTIGGLPPTNHLTSGEIDSKCPAGSSRILPMYF